MIGKLVAVGASAMTIRRHLASPDDPRPGRITLGVAEYCAMYEAATPQARKQLLGHSPGVAAQLAGVSRQAIHKAIDTGRLEAYYVHSDRTGGLAMVLIPDESLRAYLAERETAQV